MVKTVDKKTAHKTLGRLKKMYPDAKYYLHFKNNLQLLVAAILSPQVRDEVVNDATPELFKHFKTAKDYADASVDDLLNYIHEISFSGNKAKYIIKSCKLLVEKHKGKVPDTLKELTALPGVGEKTAQAILQNGFGKVVGIPVDTHVLRVSYRLGWTDQKSPKKVEGDLEGIFKQSDWKDLPHLLKAHGRALCKAPVPTCSKCSLTDVCPQNGVTKKK